MESKANVLLVGCGGIGTVAALNLEKGGLARVTGVLRSNFDIVSKNGFDIESIDHGSLKSWRPSGIVKTVPDMSLTSSQGNVPFDYVVCATKNIPDIPPTVVEVIKPAVTPGKTVIVLIQNGLNIERPLLSAFPENIVLSGTSNCSAHEHGAGIIIHDNYDKLTIGAFRNSNISDEVEDAAAKAFVKMYSAAGKTRCRFEPNVGYTRWRKLIYNACLNPICALTDLDTGRLQLADDIIDTMVKPAMQEIRTAARAAGHELGEELFDIAITSDPLTAYFPPSMQVDVRKKRYTEFENLVGEPLREGQRLGVPMPNLQFLYNFSKAVQWRTKERNGIVKIPASQDFSKIT